MRFGQILAPGRDHIQDTIGHEPGLYHPDRDDLAERDRDLIPAPCDIQQAILKFHLIILNSN
jgi:hypothetical protein